MLKVIFLRLFFVVFSALLAMSAVADSVADEPCFEAKAECLEYVREAAEWGVALAQLSLGLMYDKGRGVTTDKREAVRWYWLAAKQGNAPAQNNLGLMYYKGEGVASDQRKAVYWFRLAAEQGHADGQNNLGTMYQEGEGIATDKRKAVRWFQLAAEQGDAGAQFNLGTMYHRGEGVAKNKREAARLYRLAAEQGIAEAQNNLGAMYYKGESVVADQREAARWYRLAAEQGIAEAQYFLGLMSVKGKGEIMDKRETARWFQLAADQEHAEAQLFLGLLYAAGEGVGQDIRKGYVWLLIAKENGSKKANELLQKPTWREDLTLADIGSAEREVVGRFSEIRNRGNDTQTSNNLPKIGGEKSGIAKPPKEINIAVKVFKNTWQSVVMIKNNSGQGSGVIIRPNLVATNCHVIKGGNVAVYKPKNRRINKNVPFSAKIVYRKEAHDFCILEVKGLRGVVAKIRKYNTLQVGENVYALSAPQGLDLSLSDGLISQLRTGNNSTRFIQTNAAFSPGSSGGGLFDAEGNFIGILTSKYVGDDIEGIGFAIPADLVLEF